MKTLDTLSIRQHSSNESSDKKRFSLFNDILTSNVALIEPKVRFVIQFPSVRNDSRENERCH